MACLAKKTTRENSKVIVAFNKKIIFLYQLISITFKSNVEKKLLDEIITD